MNKLKLVVLLIVGVVKMIRTIDYMPCTDVVTPANMASAERLLTESTPLGYRLTDFYPGTRTGRNPHRWTCHFERLDNLYRYDCDYLTSLRGDFKQTCPLGCEISQVVVTQAPNRQFITIEFLVNCRCTRIPRRRRSINSCGFPWQFVAERATCTGFRNTN